MADKYRYQRKEKLWVGLPGVSKSFSGNEVSLGGSIGFAESSTVMRMIGLYVICSTSAPVVLDDAFVTVAVGVISTDAFAAGAASVPDPADEPDYPWLYWKVHAFFFAGTDPESASAAASVRVEFDIRSMRKLKARESLAMILQYVDGVGAPPLKVETSQTRVLIGLS